MLTKEVQQSPPDQRTKEGLMHTTGNVWEWTNDWYHAQTYQRDNSTNPMGPSEAIGKQCEEALFEFPLIVLAPTEPAAPDRVGFNAGLAVFGRRK